MQMISFDLTDLLKVESEPSYKVVGKVRTF